MASLFSDARSRHARRSSVPNLGQWSLEHNNETNMLMREEMAGSALPGVDGKYEHFFARFHSQNAEDDAVLDYKRSPRRKSGKRRARSLSLPINPLPPSVAFDWLPEDLVDPDAPLIINDDDEKGIQQEQATLKGADFEKPIFLWAREKSVWQTTVEECRSCPCHVVRWYMYFNGDDHRIDLLHNRRTGHKVVYVNEQCVLSENSVHMERKTPAFNRHDVPVAWTCELEATNPKLEKSCMLLLRVLDQTRKPNVPFVRKRFGYDVLVNGKPWLTSKHQLLSTPFGVHLRREFEKQKREDSLKKPARKLVAADPNWTREESPHSDASDPNIWSQRVVWTLMLFGRKYVIALEHNHIGERKVWSNDTVVVSEKKENRFTVSRYCFNFGIGVSSRASLDISPNRKGVLGDLPFKYGLEIDGTQFDTLSKTVFYH